MTAGSVGANGSRAPLACIERQARLAKREDEDRRLVPRVVNWRGIECGTLVQCGVLVGGIARRSDRGTGGAWRHGHQAARARECEIKGGERAMRNIWILAAAAAVALTVAACGDGSGGGNANKKTSAGGAGETLTIYSSLPLQGAARTQAVAAVNGAKLALE